jgi:peptide/nickel transport system permease protein
MKQSRFLAKKVGWALLTILFVILFNFFLFRVLPGDPARSGIRDPRLTQEAVEAIRVRFGLDKPVMNCFETLNPVKIGSCGVNPFETQLFIYIGNLLKGELGISYHNNRPVADILKEKLWNTVLLIGLAQILSIILGMGLGILAAYRARTTLDYGALLMSLTFWSLPTFWLGIILLFWGSNQLGLPTGGRITPGGNFSSIWQEWQDIGRHLLLPTLTYTIVFLGEYMLIMRSTLLDVLSEDYILTAKAKGLRTAQILRDHALQNAMLPMVTIIALNLGFTVGGAIQIESVFSWPGLGGAIFEAVGRKYLQTLVDIGTEKNTTIVFPLPIDILTAIKKRIVGDDDKPAVQQG